MSEPARANGRCARKHPMGRQAAIAVALSALLVLLALGPGAAGAADGNRKFAGETEQGREAKLVTDTRGRARRGSWTVLTDCDGRFKDFRAQIKVGSPLDRSNRERFRDVSSTLESDGTYSARYKHVVNGKFKGRHRIKGEITVEIVFRRDGEKYVTCTADELKYKVKELKRG